MIRSILLALDDTPGACAARDVAFALARRTGAAVTALIVLDRPHTRDAHEAVPLGASAFASRRNEKLAEAVEAEAAQVLAEAQTVAGDLTFEVVRREEGPEEALLAEGAAHDLIIIGRDSTLGREACDDGLSPTIEALLRDGARPLLVVPPGIEAPGHLAAGEALKRPVLVAHDGSMATMRTLHVFALLGLARDQMVKLLDFVPETSPEALGRYLIRHGMQAECYAVSGDVHDILLAEAQSLPAALLVLGADQESGISRLIFGSAIARLLRASPCPVFIHG
jgi:nucleotide-binding universal stress UspA family protein